LLKVLTVIIGFAHVGEKVFNLLSDNHVGNVVDSVADNIVTSTNSYETDDSSLSYSQTAERRRSHDSLKVIP
jgi:hypothetical protein